MKIIIDEKRIILSFGIFSKIISLDDIQSINIKPYNFWKYWGWGIRFSPFDKSRAWVVRSGQGILIMTKSHEYFISSLNPDRMNSVIQHRINSTVNNKHHVL